MNVKPKLYFLSFFFKVGKHDKMGTNVVPLKELTPDEPKVLTLDLLKNMDPNDPQNEKSRGQIVVELTYKPFKEDEVPDDAEDSNAVQKAPEGTPDGGGLLVIRVHEAEDVEGKYHTNPYVRLLFRGEERRTKVCLNAILTVDVFVAKLLGTEATISLAMFKNSDILGKT